MLPTIELGEYKDVEVPYHDPAVTDEDIDKRLTELREQKAQFVNVDPRPLEDGDHAVVALESLAGVEGEPVRQEEMVLELGGADTVPAFTDNLRGLTPGDEREFEVAYPEEYGSARVAGKTIRFHATVKGIRRKELPELNDEFAQDLGDYRSVDELREAIRKSNRRPSASTRRSRKPRTRSWTSWWMRTIFPCRKSSSTARSRIAWSRACAPWRPRAWISSKVKLDWEKVKETQREKAVREVKASLLLSRIAEREAIHATRDEVDREVERDRPAEPGTGRRRPHAI